MPRARQVRIHSATSSGRAGCRHLTTRDCTPSQKRARAASESIAPRRTAARSSSVQVDQGLLEPAAVVLVLDRVQREVADLALVEAGPPKPVDDRHEHARDRPLVPGAERAQPDEPGLLGADADVLADEGDDAGIERLPVLLPGADAAGREEVAVELRVVLALGAFPYSSTRTFAIQLLLSELGPRSSRYSMYRQKVPTSG